ncbi:MAG: hypothetical protein V8R16_05700 [Bacilli bacterium]
MSDNYAQRCCAFAGIRSVSKRCKYAKPGKNIKYILIYYLLI